MTHADLNVWAAMWGVSPAAVADLLALMTTPEVVRPIPGADGALESEAGVQARQRLAAARAGLLVWRNNVGAARDTTGRLIRFGLANESKQENERVKSGDLIGIETVIITEDMVGQRLGRFWSRECKRPSWSFGNTAHERAQLRWIELIVAAGGDAAFTTGVDDAVSKA